MALEDLTGTGKFVSALNPAWPVDDDWVDEGDNHIRGIKNVLKNTFPDTNAAVSWSATQARFPDGTPANPGIGWANEQNSGFRRVGPGSFEVGVLGAGAFSWTASQFNVVDLQAAAITCASVSASGDVVGGKVIVNHGFDGALGNIADSSAVLQGNGTTRPGLGLIFPGEVLWTINTAADKNLWFGTAAATGPAGLNGYSAIITANGTHFARAFSATTFAATGAVALTGALADVLKLRGVRCVDSETGLPALRVEAVEAGFPELVREAGAVKGIDTMGLVAPLIEAIRELAERVRLLEAKCAGN